MTKKGRANAQGWRRLRDGEYYHAGFGLYIDRHNHPNGHFSIWTVRGIAGQHPTLTDAKKFVESGIPTRVSKAPR